MSGGTWYNVEEVFDWIQEAPGVEGSTVSGGEPLQQKEGLLELLSLVRCRIALSVLVFTGFTVDELQHDGTLGELEPLVDVLIAGRYIPDLAVKSGLLGSSNKSVHLFSKRYTEEDLGEVPVSEVILSASGEVVTSGIDPLFLR